MVKYEKRLTDFKYASPAPAKILAQEAIINHNF